VLALSWILRVFENLIDLLLRCQFRVAECQGIEGFLVESDFCLSPIGSFLHHSPQLGIPVESVQFLMKLLLK